MLGLSEILALAIGLFFVYLLLSVITSYVTESISGLLGLRSKNLVDAIQRLLEPSTHTLNSGQRLKEFWPKEQSEDQSSSNLEALPGRFKKLNHNLLKAFYEHPIIQSLSRPGRNPSYISPRDFTITLLDLLMDSSQTSSRTPAQYMAELKQNINYIKEDFGLGRSLLPLIEDAELMDMEPDKQIARVRQNIDSWYITTMERTSGWYKNRVQVINIIIGLLVAIILNADTIDITQTLWKDAALRQGLEQVAQGYNQQADMVDLQKIMDDMGRVRFPLGWSPLRDSDGIPFEYYKSLATPFGVISKMMGLFITALAISVGSSIWFDILNRVINLRSTGVKPQL